ncbi:MAG: PDZ domain-containing protein [Bacteroidetes bacterium]|nr:PDZ domain-containing protein [Bacteroidota bacterium]
MLSFKRKILLLLLPVALLGTLAFTNVSYFEITKNLDIFATLYKELNTFYVDTLQPEKLMRAGIHEMLTNLDPYTEFIPEEEMDDYRTQTTGRYGGIGALIGVKNDWVIITDPYEGFPAARAGLRAGDKIFEVNGKSAKNYKTEQVSAMLKGKAGTEVNVKILRLQADGSEKEMEVKMIREEIKIKNVPYYGMLNDKIGYILLSGFTDRAGAEVKNALTALESKHKLKGLVLDLRGNPGGLLNEAINVANIFVDKNIEIVSTKGKSSADWNKSFYSLNDPVDLKIPLVVLADGGSASAAEIVSGSLQDLDRAVVVGERTYGKGLVQTTLSLPFNGKLKVTTAKYYIPSGRCIQAINYAEKNEDGSVKRIPDSLKVAFKTKNGRTVYDGGGVDPDVKAEGEKLSNIAFSLVTKSLLFDYANQYRARNEKIGDPKQFTLSDAAYYEFVEWVKKQDYTYTTRSEKLLEDFKKTAEKENYFGGLQVDFEAMEKTMQSDKQKDFEKEKAQIKSLLEEEIIARYYLTSGRIQASQKWDKELEKAVEILNDEKKMKEILAKK